MSEIQTVARVYAHVHEDKPREFFEFEDFNPQLDDVEDYRLLSRLGRGKYSEVFEAVHTPTKKTVVLKMLRPIKKKKIKREIKVLEMLKGGTNIVNLQAIVRIDILSVSTVLVFEQISKVNFRHIYLKLSEYDTRLYIYELLQALDYCHSKGIMHRDVKPHNIIVDHNRHRLQLIDFGLAEFYCPKQEYNVRVASLYFKAPELLVDYVYYDYSLDMWSVGCMFAAMIFRKEPFFHGNSHTDQLLQIVKVRGTYDFDCYLDNYNIEIEEGFRNVLGNHRRKKWDRFVDTENEYLVNEDAIDLLESLLRYDHLDRITANEALQHKYFIPVILDKQAIFARGNDFRTNGEIVETTKEVDA